MLACCLATPALLPAAGLQYGTVGWQGKRQGKLEGCLVGLWKEASQTGGRAYGRAGRKQARAAGWKLFGWRAGGQA